MAELDLFVIGGGSGGVACARRAASHGARVAIAEASRVGGTCVIRGCVPKKLMHYGAHFKEVFGWARGYGWSSGAETLDFRALLEGRNKEIARLNGIYLQLLERSGVTVVPHRARIEGRSDEGFRIEAGGESFLTKAVLIAVGGRPSLPEVPGIELTLTSDHVLEDVYDFPKRVAIVGGGYIGVEFASIFSVLGAETSMVLRGDTPLRGFDDDLRAELTGQLTAHGLKVEGNRGITAVERTADGVRILTDKGVIEADLAIYATGRAPIPNTRGLGLDGLGVLTTATGAIKVDASYASNVPGIYAVGDCSDHTGQHINAGAYDLTPIAIAEGRALAERLYNDTTQRVLYATTPTAIFSLPEASAVGMSEAAARAAGHDVVVYRTKFRPLLQTVALGEQRTMMKLVVDKSTDRVLGCHMVGADAAEIIQGFAVALTAGATKRCFDETVALHPTAAEEFVTMYQPVA